MILEVQDVSKHFGGLAALDRIAFSVPEGQIVGVIGPNGAGKTTVFNVINGVYKPDKGRIIFRGEDITGRAPFEIARRGIARTHQIVRPLGELSVRDNVIAGACFGQHNLSLPAAALVADDVLEFVGLATKSAMLAVKLNVAQKKRLELARALAARPLLLLLDEVLSGLNPQEVAEMLDVIRKIREQGITLIVIEHLMHAVMKISDQVIALDYGKKIAEGTPQEVMNDPKVVESYLGDPKVAERFRVGLE